jgi:predicted O-methyltransferase YrrM
MKTNLFERYPQLNTLRALVPDELIEEEVGSRVEEFEKSLAGAKRLISTVNLNKVFPAELERSAIQLENFLGHWGNVSVEELCKICLIVKWLRPKRVLELGTYNGMTTLQMALNAPPDCVVYTLDLPPEQTASLPLGRLDELVAKHFKERFNTRIGSYFENREDVRIVQLWGDTATFDYSVLGGPVDLIFVDAAHDYQNKRHDCETAFRALMPGGVILWHDYAQVVNPEVTRCLDEYAADRPIFHLRNTNLAVYYGAVAASKA